MSDTGWVCLRGLIVGNLETWTTVYYWDGVYHADKQGAVDEGFEITDTDDFNVGYVEKGVLTWFGWMDEQHPVEDYAAVATQHGWSA
jgi:hypothetical protein